MTHSDTRTRILVTSLLLFNEQGVGKSTTNQIADATDISPGNLHYHFRKKSQIVEALLTEFQADARSLPTSPADGNSPVAEFWSLLHDLLEILTAYRFLFRDTDSLISEYAKVRVAMHGFARALLATVRLHLDALADAKVLDLNSSDRQQLSRNIVTIALYEDRLQALTQRLATRQTDPLETARSVMAALIPFARPESRPLLHDLLKKYADREKSFL